LEHSLSALLPVRNAEATLEGAVSEMLEVLPELTSRFELVIVDDCSCDATIEVADELGGTYPQLVVVRHARPQGRTAAIQTGLRRSRGEVIFVADEDCELSLAEVRKVWDELSQHELILGRSAATRRRPHFSHRPSEPGGQRGYQMGYRRALLSVASAMADQGTLLYYLRRNGLQWHEVEISDRTPRSAPRRIAAMARSLFAPHDERADRSQRADQPQPIPSRPRQPNYLTRLKDFALGE
jgi:glycosyltransferase involved in cell wall biosynthesis